MFENVIAQDCQAMYDSKKRVTVIADGKVVGFEDEKMYQTRKNKKIAGNVRGLRCQPVGYAIPKPFR